MHTQAHTYYTHVYTYTQMFTHIYTKMFKLHYYRTNIITPWLYLFAHIPSWAAHFWIPNMVFV